MADSPKRHCWECLRRCLVCDSTTPTCTRCARSGTACPGYDEKPRRLKWLAPGRVTSHRRRPKGTRPSGKVEAESEESSRKLDLSRFKMRTNACAIFEAAQYFNACIHPELLPMLGLGPNPGVYPISPALMQLADAVPDHLTLSVVCMTISHRIHRLRCDANRRDLAEKLYRFRGDVLLSLNQELSLRSGRRGDVLFAGIVSFLLAEIQLGPSPNWRCHLVGLRDLIRLRGGLQKVSSRKGMTPLLHCYLLGIVLGDTTSPASNLAIAAWRHDEIESVLNLYNADTNPCRTCPPQLFAEIIKINCLRSRAASSESATRSDLADEGHQILIRILSFRRENWAALKPSSSRANWLLLCEIHECAIALYCILSLQSVAVLPDTIEMSTIARSCTSRLSQLLRQALTSPITRLSVLWSLVVLGVEVGHPLRAGATQTFIKDALLEMGHRVGSFAPLAAAEVLQRFWTSGKGSWDDCFDQPHLFLAQTAVDVSGISID
ncbi:C6 zinc finger domain-protein [Podospora aff. communis PSN243]|uniref:C6 zinc finger domain-protein n=1 Tax=Podospora aff. communis PSN243 TaxID=3040156 RepID=A0AAV9G7Z0_9PEZI|nr:C6 zinc finger domain-protein [Podospora aff. communis PSN243]